ncbi:unnamed protein product [Xylocopa violacea]|uniref:Uncharacterized protein n=1 Tax=Xylocopa violacea TaxID=135666 RepID=A0ABP1MWI8_XYLVO
MAVFYHIRRLLRDFSFLLKVYELIAASICVRELTKYNEYTIPRWLWIIYCIDSATYFLIYLFIATTHVFEKPRRLPVSCTSFTKITTSNCIDEEFTYFSLGVIFHLIGAIAGIVRSRYEEPDDSDVTRSELKIGLLLMGNFVVLFCESAHIAYTEYDQAKFVVNNVQT